MNDMIDIYEIGSDEIFTTIEEYELEEFFIDNIITKEWILELYDECYPEVETPMGRLAMSTLMESYMSDTDWRCVLNDEADFRVDDLQWYYDDETGAEIAEDYGFRFVRK